MRSLTVRDKPYFYDQSLKRYLLQIGGMMAGYQVRTGVQRDGQRRRLVVPCIFGGLSRLVSYYQQGGGDNVAKVLPIMSIQVVSLTQQANMRRNHQHSEQISYTERSVGAEGDQTGSDSGRAMVAERTMPVPYELVYDLHGLCSNDDQVFQLVEQIGTVFAPEMDVFLGNSPLDWASVTKVVFDGSVKFGRTGTDVGGGGSTYNHTFSMGFAMSPVYMSSPVKVYEAGVIDRVEVNIVESVVFPPDWDDTTPLEEIVIE